jgi:hypothetical protein
MKNLRVALLVFSVFILLGAMLLILWANWPPSIATNTTTLHLIAPGSWEESSADQIGEQTFTLTLIYPEILKTGQIAHYHLEISQLPATVMVGGSEFQLRVRCELILPGILNQQEGMFTQTVQDKKAVRFSWDVRAFEPQSVAGTLRLFVDYISPDNTIDQQLISVTELHLTGVSLSGLSTTTATSLAVALVLLSGLAGGLGLTRSRIG